MWEIGFIFLPRSIIFLNRQYIFSSKLLGACARKESENVKCVKNSGEMEKNVVHIKKFAYYYYHSV